MKKRLLKILCVVLSVVIVIVSITFLRKDKPVNQQIETTQSTTQEQTTEESTTAETTTEEETETTETTTIPEETTTVKPTQPITIDSLQSLVTATGIKYNAMSIQVATIVDGQVHATAEYGWAEKNVRPMTSDTKIRVASLSKTILALVVYRLIDDGMLELDTDISEYLGYTVQNPSHPDVPITLRVLLAHSSGLVNASYVHSLEQLQNHLQKPSAYTRHKPGTHYEYNNFAYGIVGTMCELVTGKSVTTLLNEYFFIPMGIEASYIPNLLNPDKIAVLYDEYHNITRGVRTQQNQLSFTETAGKGFKLYAGGLTISAKDYAKLLTLFMNDGVYDGVRYLSSESVELIHSVQLDRVAGKIGQGMPVLTRYRFYGGKKLQYHTGSAYGVFSIYTYDRATKTGVVVLTIGARQARDVYSIYGVCADIAKGVHENNFVE
jgi:CubicO group peptidase (beta-lactamase class C family)